MNKKRQTHTPVTELLSLEKGMHISEELVKVVTPVTVGYNEDNLKEKDWATINQSYTESLVKIIGLLILYYHISDLSYY